MKKLPLIYSNVHTYCAPTIEVVDVLLEQGYAGSGTWDNNPTVSIENNITPY